MIARAAAPLAALAAFLLPNAASASTAQNVDAGAAIFTDPVKRHQISAGARLKFLGLRDQQMRAGLMANLPRVSSNASNIPEAEVAAQGTMPELDPAILTLVGDPEYGAYLASACLTCHLADGTARGIPSITGWPTENFVATMHAYKVKLRPHPVMQMIAGRLNNEEIAALAAYFKDLK